MFIIVLVQQTQNINWSSKEIQLNVFMDQDASELISILIYLKLKMQNKNKIFIFFIFRILNTSILLGSSAIDTILGETSMIRLIWRLIWMMLLQTLLKMVSIVVYVVVDGDVVVVNANENGEVWWCCCCCCF